jgi:hypothetical protein
MALHKRMFLVATAAILHGCVGFNEVTVNNESGRDLTVVLSTADSARRWQFTLKLHECAQVRFKVNRDDNLMADVEGTKHEFGYYTGNSVWIETYDIRPDLSFFYKNENAKKKCKAMD